MLNAPSKGTATFTTLAPNGTAALALAAKAQRLVALIANNGTGTVYLGKTAGVTTANGLPLAAGATLVDDTTTGAWYAVTSGATGDLRIVEVA